MAEYKQKLEVSDETNIPSERLSVSGVDIVLCHKGPKLTVQKKGTNEVVINVERYPTRELALRDGIFKAAQLNQTQDYIASNPREALNVLQNNKDYGAILRLLGIKHLSGETNQALNRIKNIQPDVLGLSEQFQFACEHYLFTGSLPAGLSAEVIAAFNAIPKSERSLHLLDEIASEEYVPEANLEMYGYVKAAYEAIKVKEKVSVEEFRYRPQIGTGEEEPLNPNDIETKVTPFYGGYYRGYVCRYDPDKQEIVQEVSSAQRFHAENLEDADQLKKRTYETVYNPGKDNNLELPYNAYPLTDTLSPQGKFEIFRTESGSFYLKPKQGSSPPKKKIAVKFDFVLKQNPENSLQDEPGGEVETMGGDLDHDAEQFLDSLKQNNHLTNSEKARRCAEYVRKRFKYPEDEGQRNAMNQLYLSGGNNVLPLISQHGITDCYWSNIFCGELLHRLGIHHRVIAGHYVTKDPRFDFAAVAGTGHAWGEVWTGEEWIKDGIDATPPKEKNENDEEEDSSQQEGDFGSTSPEEQEELSLDEIRTLFEELLKEASKEDPSSPEAIFEQNTGVALARWKEIEKFIKSVNETPVPPDTSIKGRSSTVGKEWDELFHLIYKKREIPEQGVRGPVRRSEAEGIGELDDPVDAATDLLSGEDDPLGYKIEVIKPREETHIMEFEDDAILDLTASMEGTPAEEQKKMLLSGLYNLMQLNRRLNLDKYRKTMKAPLTLRSHVLSFKGDDLVSELHDPTADIDEKALSTLFDQLGKTQTGEGNLVGALKAYERKLDARTLSKVSRKQMVKVLTIVSDGAVKNQPDAVEIIKRLRGRGIIVQGIGFGSAAQDIRVICHDPLNAEAGVAIDDVRQAVPTRHKMLARLLKKM